MSSNQTCEDSGVPAFIRDKLVLYPEPVRRLATELLSFRSRTRNRRYVNRLLA